MGQSVHVSGVLSGANDSAPPGWYPDPWRVAPYRWWDGASWTGNVSPPSTGLAPGVALGNQTEFVGGMNVPSALGGRLNATFPLVALTIGEATLRMHPRWLAGAMFSDFEVPLHEITAAFLLRSAFLRSGLGFELSDGQPAYFWTFQNKGRVLAVLQQRGVPIDRVPRRRGWGAVGTTSVVVELGPTDSFSRQVAGARAADEGADAILPGRRDRRHSELRLEGNVLRVVRSCRWNCGVRPASHLFLAESLTEDAVTERGRSGHRAGPDPDR